VTDVDSVTNYSVVLSRKSLTIERYGQLYLVTVVDFDNNSRSQCFLKFISVKYPVESFII
jgi:hypothetical protein